MNTTYLLATAALLIGCNAPPPQVVAPVKASPQDNKTVEAKPPEGPPVDIEGAASALICKDDVTCGVLSVESAGRLDDGRRLFVVLAERRWALQEEPLPGLPPWRTEAHDYPIEYQFQQYWKLVVDDGTDVQPTLLLETCPYMEPTDVWGRVDVGDNQFIYSVSGSGWHTESTYSLQPLRIKREVKEGSRLDTLIMTDTWDFDGSSDALRGTQKHVTGCYESEADADGRTTESISIPMVESTHEVAEVRDVRLESCSALVGQVGSPSFRTVAVSAKDKSLIIQLPVEPPPGSVLEIYRSPKLSFSYVCAVEPAKPSVQRLRVADIERNAQGLRTAVVPLDHSGSDSTVSVVLKGRLANGSFFRVGTSDVDPERALSLGTTEWIEQDVATCKIVDGQLVFERPILDQSTGADKPALKNPACGS